MAYLTYLLTYLHIYRSPWRFNVNRPPFIFYLFGIPANLWPSRTSYPSNAIYLYTYIRTYVSTVNMTVMCVYTLCFPIRKKPKGARACSLACAHLTQHTSCLLKEISRASRLKTLTLVSRVSKKRARCSGEGKGTRRCVWWWGREAER